MTCQRLLRATATIALCSGLPASLVSAYPFQDDYDRASGQVIRNTGQRITPLAARGTRFEPLNPGLKNFPNDVASQAVTSVVSPDKKTLLVLTSGYNLQNATSGSNAGRLLEEFSIGAPASLLPPSRSTYNGNNSDSVTLSPDESTPHVTNGNTNNVSVVSLATRSVSGLIPTAWYPDSVSFSAEGSYMYIVNGQSTTGPKPGYCHGDVLPGKSAAECNASNEYDLQLLKAGLASLPTPQASQLAGLTEQVAANNHYARTESASSGSF